MNIPGPDFDFTHCPPPRSVETTEINPPIYQDDIENLSFERLPSLNETASKPTRCEIVIGTVADEPPIEPCIKLNIVIQTVAEDVPDLIIPVPSNPLPVTQTKTLTSRTYAKTGFECYMRTQCFGPCGGQYFDDTSHLVKFTSPPLRISRISIGGGVFNGKEYISGYRTRYKNSEFSIERLRVQEIEKRKRGTQHFVIPSGEYVKTVKLIIGADAIRRIEIFTSSGISNLQLPKNQQNHIGEESIYQAPEGSCIVGFHGLYEPSSYNNPVRITGIGFILADIPK